MSHIKRGFFYEVLVKIHDVQKMKKMKRNFEKTCRFFIDIKLLFDLQRIESCLTISRECLDLLEKRAHINNRN